MGIRIFDYLNISTQNSLWSDSGFHVQRKFINYCGKKGKDYHFYLTVPREYVNDPKLIKEFEYYNVTLLPWEYRPINEMRFDFNSKLLHNMLDSRRRDYDIIWNNQPELAPHFKSVFNYKIGYQTTPIINYVHWLNDEKGTGYSVRDEFGSKKLALMTGILTADITKCNSFFGKERIIGMAKELFNDDVVKKIETKIEPLFLGIDNEELDRYKTTEKFDKFTIVFNHRLLDYTGHYTFMKYMKKLRETRQDFQVIFTNPSRLPRYINEFKNEYTKIGEKYPFDKYIELLWKADMVVGFHKGFNQWSMSGVEGLMCENYMLHLPDNFFPEIFPDTIEKNNEYTFKNEKEFLNKINYLIDNREETGKKAKELSIKIRELHSWNNRIDDWIDTIEKAYEMIPTKGDTNTMLKLRNELNTKKTFRKNFSEVMDTWGTMFDMSSYRKSLLKTSYEDIKKADTIYYKNKEDIPQKKIIKKALTDFY